MREKFEVASLGIFGSFARGQNNEESDLDILVSYYRVPGYFKFVELQYALTELVGIEVDLVTETGLKPYVRETVLHDLQMI